MDPMQIAELAAMIAELLPLSDLKACTTVCKGWYHALRPCLWATLVLSTKSPAIHFSPCSITITTAAPTATTTTATRAKSCTTTGCKGHLQCTNQHVLRKNARFVRHLKLMYLHERRQPQAIYNLLAQECASLVSLSLDIAPKFWDTMRQLLVRNRGLRILQLETKGHIDWLTRDMLLEAMASCPNLEELTLDTEFAPSHNAYLDCDSADTPPSPTFNLRRLTLVREYDPRLATLLHQCPRLEHLAIGTAISVHALTLASFWTTISSRCSAKPTTFGCLSSLEIGPGPFQHRLLQAATLATKPRPPPEQALPALRSITIHYPSEKSIVALSEDPHHAVNLEHLDLRLGISRRDALAGLFTHCRALKSLAITTCGPRTIDLQNLAPLPSIFPSPPTTDQETPGTAPIWGCLNLETLRLSVALRCPQAQQAFDPSPSWILKEEAKTRSTGCISCHDPCANIECQEAQMHWMERLGTLTRLRRLQIVPSTHATSQGQHDLSWRLDRGLDRLAQLRLLAELDLGESTPFLGGIEELQWMKTHWPALRRLVCARVHFPTSRHWLRAQWPQLQVVELGDIDHS